MTRIVATNYISLDGVIEDPVGMEGSGLGNWTGPCSRGNAGDQFKTDELFAADCLIFGRKTYESFAAAWPQVKGSAMADRMNGLPKYVASGTLEHASWGDTAIWKDELVSAVEALKAEDRRDALIYGRKTFQLMKYWSDQKQL